MAAISGIYSKRASSYKLQHRSLVKVQQLQLQLLQTHYNGLYILNVDLIKETKSKFQATRNRHELHAER